MFKKIISVAILGILPMVTSATDLDAKKIESRMAIKAFGGALKTELVAAMKAGGPVKAIGVCNTEAPIIADKISATGPLTVSRTSLKTRNADNTPNDWQTTVLNDFDAAKAVGEKPSNLEYAEIVDTDDGQEFRYMKAIPTGDVCLKCHGTQVNDKVTSRLKELYPEDKATGYHKGDLRGAFIVVEKLQ